MLGGQYPVGVGLKAQHYDEVLDSRPALDFFEVHAENYMMEGGAHHRYLEAICDHYRLSIHGVGMSLGSATGLDADHLKRFKELVERYRPWLVSEHLAWSRSGGAYLNDLLPLPLTQESFQVVCDNVSRMQDVIGRQILIENPSSYLAFEASDIPEVEFLGRLACQTDCGLLLDVNNVYVSGCNMGWDVGAYLDSVPASLIGEIHLAGHQLKKANGHEIRIDDHGSAVPVEVWQLYRQLIERVGARPTLIEWDNNIPDFSALLNEASSGRNIMQAVEKSGWRKRHG
ncbi:MAG: DUF692 domain-containing protein [Alphaproteobacteria bacterium]|nr:DUF692 domain-containing protein [Alphaproteobacteria bacterium]